MDTSTNPADCGIPAIAALIEAHFNSSSHSWSIGIPGAIGEFMYDDGENVSFSRDEATFSILTGRGAMQIRLRPEIKCVAFEELSACTRSWSQQVAFCLPAGEAAMPKHEVLTYAGRDKAAIKPGGINEHLFDLGMGSPHVQFCVRSGDADLVRILKENCGLSIFDPNNPSGASVLEHSPTRVVISALGRVEIETRIPKTHSDTLAGPHTHLLPALLNSKREENDKLPTGFVECLTLYPEHPAFDKYGEPREFQSEVFNSFQHLLASLGPVDYLEKKNRALETVVRGVEQNETGGGTNLSRDPVYKIAKIQEALINGV